jgi:hypothetical protein
MSPLLIYTIAVEISLPHDVPHKICIDVGDELLARKDCDTLGAEVVGV